MKKFGFLLLLSSLMNLSSAQTRLETFHEEETADWVMREYVGDPMKVRYYTFKSNGLTLITSENHAEPRIQTMVAVKTGSKNDPSSNTGLAHYLEHMLFKGTDQYGSLDWEKEKPFLDQIDALYEVYNKQTDAVQRKATYKAIDSVSQLAANWAIANEFDKMCQALGAQGTNAFTSNEMTVYVNDIPSNSVEKWLKLESERYRNPVLRLFHTELEAVYEEKNISLDSDGDRVWETLYADLFPHHNYGLQTTIGTVEHLKNPSLNAIRDYFYTYYVPNNMAVIMAGDLNPDQTAAEVLKAFSYMQAKDVPVYAYEMEPYRNSPRSYDVSGPDAEDVTIGFRIPGAGTAELAAIKLIDMLLSNSSAGLVDLNLVQKQKLGYAYTYIDEMKDYSTFIMGGGPNPGQSLEEVRDLLLSQLDKIRRGDFDSSLIQAIILNQEIGRIQGFESNENRAYFLMSAFVNGLDYRQVANELADQAKISTGTLIDVANALLNQDYCVVYKRLGETPTSPKIEKPAIHPVELNRDKQSDFLKQFMAMPTQPILPEFVNIKKEVQVSKGYGDRVEFLYTQNRDNRLFNLSLRYWGGDYLDMESSLALDYLNYCGSKAFSREQLSTELFRLGCDLSVGSSNLYSTINISGPQESMERALMLVEQLLTQPEVEEETFQNMVGQILFDRENAKRDPNTINGALMNYMIYGPNNPYTRHLSETQLKALHASDMVNRIKELWNRPFDVAYYGPASTSEVQEMVERAHTAPASFSPTLKNFPGCYENPMFSVQSYTQPTVYFVHYNMVRALLTWYKAGEHLPMTSLGTVQLFNQYFGGDMSSVVFQNIREAKALAYSCGARYNCNATYPGNLLYKQPDLTYARMGTQADKLPDAIPAMNELLQTLPLNDEVLKGARNAVINQISTERIGRSQYNSLYWSLEDNGASSDEEFTRPRMETLTELSPLTMADLNTFHQTHIAGSAEHPYVIGVVGSKRKISKKVLKPYGKVEQLSLEDLFAY
jgi:predicted Zn-dependent peptidase